VAAHGDVVYVLNTRDGGSIQGYRSFGPLLAPIPPWHRALGLEPNATPEFLTAPRRSVRVITVVLKLPFVRCSPKPSAPQPRQEQPLDEVRWLRTSRA
jgi:hypothetical protein